MKKKYYGIAACIAGNAIFGFSFLFSRLALDVTEPSVLIAVRFVTAFLILNIIVLAGKILKKADGTPLVRFTLKGKPKKDILLLALFQPVLYFIAENYGIAMTSSAFAGIIIAMIPLAGILFDALFMRERPGRLQIICAFLSAVGVVLTAVGAADMKGSLKGLLVLLIAVAAGALFYVFSKKSADFYSPLERTYVMFGCGAVFYTLFAAVRVRIVGPEILNAAIGSGIFWCAILYLALVSSVAAFLLLNFGSAYVSVTGATLFANITTVISILAGVLILREDFSWLQGVGAAVILASICAAQIGGKGKAVKVN